jgi:predicted O-methyltransferase YrrM
MNIQRFVGNFLEYRNSLKTLRKLEKAFTNSYPLEVTQRFKGFGEYEKISAKQVPYEINTLYDMVQQSKPRYICEIGTYRGGTLYLWCKAAVQNATIISCDLPNGLDNAYSKNRIKFYRHFAQKKQKLYFIAADSHSTDTVNLVKAKLGNAQLDFLFIDGDHLYNGVRSDFELYRPLVCKGGIIAFHDILPRDLPHVQVDKFWNEVKCHYPYQEIIAREGESANFIGIGVIWND